jgi:sugar lactone lactonase YvrE
MSSAFDLTTLTYDSQYVGSTDFDDETLSYFLYVSPDEKTFYMDAGDEDIARYTTATAGNMGGVSYGGLTSFSLLQGNAFSIAFEGDGLVAYVTSFSSAGSNTNSNYKRLVLGTAYKIESATSHSSVNLGTGTALFGIGLSPNGEVGYVLDAPDDLRVYKMGATPNVWTTPDTIVTTLLTDPVNPASLSLSSDGKKLISVDWDTGNLFEYSIYN